MVVNGENVGNLESTFPTFSPFTTPDGNRNFLLYMCIDLPPEYFLHFWSLWEQWVSVYGAGGGYLPWDWIENFQKLANVQDRQVNSGHRLFHFPFNWQLSNIFSTLVGSNPWILWLQAGATSLQRQDHLPLSGWCCSRVGRVPTSDFDISVPLVAA